ncbi:hypothetical protein ACQV5M_20150, partial [Leptospira sp. SA-E8]|uniref:hypothetical protein n=1 Tax=Leptospira sp. SA-E8 TaxID=3422259 RepID=UPI003EBE5285
MSTRILNESFQRRLALANEAVRLLRMHGHTVHCCDMTEGDPTQPVRIEVSGGNTGGRLAFEIPLGIHVTHRFSKE